MPERKVDDKTLKKVGDFLDHFIPNHTWPYGYVALVDVLCLYEDWRVEAPAVHAPKPQIEGGMFSKREYKPPVIDSAWKDHQ